MGGWTAIATIIAALFGGGGLAAVLNWRHQKRAGVRQEDRADDDALAERAKAMLEAQFTYLMKPLQEEVTKLRTELDTLKAQMAAEGARYSRLLAYTRLLRDWVAKHFTDQSPPPPQPSEDLLVDL